MTFLMGCILALAALLPAQGAVGSQTGAPHDVLVRPGVAPRQVAGPAAALRSGLGTPLIAGQANYADPSHGSGYLAMRLDRGTHVRICGAGGCTSMIVNDYGPVEATGDIADIALVRFAKVCGYTIPEAKRRGECAVEVEVGVRIALPPTDTEGEPE